MSELKLLALVGPSGSGKSTIGKLLNLPVLRSVTTRQPRKGELEEGYYRFISEEDFFWLRDNDLLVEDVAYAGKYYGTLKSDWDEMLQSDDVYYAPLTLEGVHTFSKLLNPEVYTVTSVFVFVPRDEVIQRMLMREADPDLIVQRINRYSEDMASANYCDFGIMNLDGKLENTVKLIKSLLDN